MPVYARWWPGGGSAKHAGRSPRPTAASRGSTHWKTPQTKALASLFLIIKAKQKRCVPCSHHGKRLGEGRAMVHHGAVAPNPTANVTHERRVDLKRKRSDDTILHH